MILRLLVFGAAAALADPMAIYDQALDARQARDAQRFLQLTGQLTEWAPTNPALHFLHAEALALSGRTAPALDELRWLATHGYHYAFWERDTFENLPAGAETAALRAAITKNGSARRTNRARSSASILPISMRRESMRWGRTGSSARWRTAVSIASTAPARRRSCGARPKPRRSLFGVRHDRATQPRMGLLRQRPDDARGTTAAAANLVAIAGGRRARRCPIRAPCATTSRCCLTARWPFRIRSAAQSGS